MNSKKRIVFLSLFVPFLLLLLCIFPTHHCYAYSVTEETNVYDDANLLTSTEIDQLDKKIASINQKNGYDIYIVTTNDDQGYSSDLYADYFFDEGHNQKHIIGEDTVILLINMDYREVWISGYGKCEQIITDRIASTIAESITSDLSDHQYYSACNLAVKKISEYMTKDFFYFHLWFQALVAFGLGGIIVGVMAISRTTPITTNANTYLDQQHSKMRFHHDNYIRTVVTKRRKPQENHNGGSHGGGSHSGPSGHSHSGGGARF